MENYIKTASTSVGALTYYEFPASSNDYYVKHVWEDSSQALIEYVRNAPTLSGYDLIATVNGGAFKQHAISRSPLGSLQKYNSSGQWTEFSSNTYYGDAPHDFMIKNGQVSKIWLNDNTVVNPKPELLRAGYVFDIVTVEDGSLQVVHNGSDSSVINNADYRAGFAFRDNTAYLIVVLSQITAEVLKELCASAGYSAYVNLDGGSSVGLYLGYEYEVHVPGRGLNEAIYVYKKRATTPDNPDEPSVPNDPTQHQTMRLSMTTPTISPNRYPTRPSINGTYNPSSYFINTGDVVVISDIKAASDGNVVCQIADCMTNGVSSSVLNGRWFVYDKNNFS